MIEHLVDKKKRRRLRELKKKFAAMPSGAYTEKQSDGIELVYSWHTNGINSENDGCMVHVLGYSYPKGWGETEEEARQNLRINIKKTFGLLCESE